ncbi:ketosteroid isomerase-like protein [Sphingobium fontiphilum]|uniref:Ketosteroid isomerase-like protein n=1 Tax=Sphingobium fontiphilum TaxID=944425 RepID=A0A7W6DLH2_9SPHN|nr:nuclear transport factor 2 family protein [Sphingobium fontiphilum]MBB3982830.1 ketosteroid isomerase-like protein [Sphingobium fontiphilum]
MPNLATIETLGERFAAALGAGDIAALDALFAPDFEVWYNFSDATLDRKQALTFFQSYFTAVQVRFRNVRRLPTPDGWVQQHRVDARGADGFRIDNLPAIIVFTLRDDRIARIEEYLDSAQTGGFDASTMTAG